MNRFLKTSSGLALAVLAAVLLAIGPAFAQEAKKKVKAESGEVFMSIGEVTVRAPGEVRKYADLPGSVDVIGADQIEKENVESALELLRLVPGVKISDYGSGGVPNGFTMRGWALGHGRGAVATIDGIPYNYHMGSSDGAIDLSQLCADDVVRIDVVKGPIDARYANWNQAGVLHFHTRKRGDFTRAKITYGDFQTKKGYVSIGREHGKFSQVYTMEYFDTVGYRENSDYKRQNMYGKWFYRPEGEDLQIGFIFHVYDADWVTAGYLPGYLWKVDPKQSVMEDDGGWKDLTEAQIHFDWQITDRMPLEAKFWVIGEDYSRWANWGGGQTESHFEHKIYGGLANLGYEAELAGGKALRLDFGGDYRHFDTMEQNFNTTFRHRTGLNRQNNYILNNLGFYAKANFDPFRMLRLFGGVRYDTFDGDAADEMAGTKSDMSQFDAWSYSGGAVVTFRENYSVYANFGTAFSLPVGASKYEPNPPDPADLFHWEIGFKADPVDWLVFRYAYFESRNDDEIRWSAGDWTHQGETLRKGHELELSLTPIDNLEFFVAYTAHDATYEAGVNKGNTLTTIPEYIFKLGAEYTAPTNTSFRVWYRDVGECFTTADNLHEYEGFQLWDIGVSQLLAKHWTLALDVKNALDEQYSEFVGYWTDPFGIQDDQYAGSDGRNVMLTLRYNY